MTHTVVVANTANVQLRRVLVSTALSTSQVASVTGLSAYSCSLNGGNAFQLSSPGATVPKAGVLSCSTTYAFATIDTIEAGDLTFDTTVSAAGMDAVLGPAQTVAVPSVPHFTLSIDQAACPAPSPNFAGKSVS